MKSQQRAQKIIALSRLMEGNTTLVKALKPQPVIDLDTLSGDELEFIRTLQTSLPPDELKQWSLERLEAHFGRKLNLIPRPTEWAL